MSRDRRDPMAVPPEKYCYDEFGSRLRQGKPLFKGGMSPLTYVVILTILGFMVGFFMGRVMP